MARKDEIFMSFLKHEIIQEQYNIPPADLPKTIQEGLDSKHAIIKTLAVVVENTEGPNNILTDKALYAQITQFLNLETNDY